jgi:hypothetical protein
MDDQRRAVPRMGHRLRLAGIRRCHRETGFFQLRISLISPIRRIRLILGRGRGRGDGLGAEERGDRNREGILVVPHPDGVAEETWIGGGEQAEDGRAQQGGFRGEGVGAGDGFEDGFLVEGRDRVDAGRLGDECEEGREFAPGILADVFREERFGGCAGLLFEPGQERGVGNEAITAFAGGFQGDPDGSTTAHAEVDRDEGNGSEDTTRRKAGTVGHGRQ